MATNEDVLARLAEVVDPASGVTITDLGLVYGVEIEGGSVASVLIANEPVARRLVPGLRAALEKVPGLTAVRVEFVLEPRWDLSRATPEAREKLAAAATAADPATETSVWDQLALVIEPELGLPITDLGLIYGVDLAPDGRGANVRMTLTSPMCPIAPYLMELVRVAALQASGLREATVELVWDPPWDPRTMATEDAQADLGLI